MRRALGPLAVLAAFVLLAAGVWLLRLRRGPTFRTGEVAVAGLSAPVEVLRDGFGIPHVWASSAADAFFAQGWLHASDRLWQMEMFRRVAAGRLSELFGEATVESDRFLRTLGMGRAAERTLETLDPDTREVLEAYAAGVNAALAGWRGPRPPELTLLRADVEPWRAVDPLAIEKIMAWDLAEYGQTLDLTEARRRLDDAGWEVVRPRWPDGGTTILPGPEDAGGASASPDTAAGGGPADDAPLPPPEPVLPHPSVVVSARVPPPARALLERASIVRASNAWVVGGERSASGKPLLANDMHLGLSLPPIWYLVGLHAPGLDVVGMSIPGAPGVVAGHSAAVAWGFTNAGVDDVDLFVERPDPGDTTRYLVPGGSEPFRTRVELLRVRGRDAPDTLVVRETRHGPVVSPVESRAGGELLALRWVALDPSPTTRALVGMNRAGSVEDFLVALEGFRNPHQNVVFADTAGRFGYWMAGRVPLRASGAPPLLPVPGWTGEHDWEGDLPFEDHPHVLDPDAGFVATANNRQSPAGVSSLVADGTWAPPYRAQRITELLEARPAHDAASMLAVQMDVGSAFAARHLHAVARALEGAGHPDAARLLEGWDAGMRPADAAPTVFWTFVRGVRDGLMRDLYGGRSGTFPMRAVEEALETGTLPADVVETAAAAAAAAAGTPWGEAHTLSLDHALAGVPWIGGALGFGRSGIPRAGDGYTVNVAGFGGAAPPFTVTHGPSQRHVVDLDDLDGEGGFVLPGGQSGWPGSPHADDQLPLWRDGRLVRLPMSRGAVEAVAEHRLTLVPGG